MASAVLLAMGVEPDDALGTVRLSLGRLVAETQIPEILRILEDGWRTARGKQA